MKSVAFTAQGSIMKALLRWRRGGSDNTPPLCHETCGNELAMKWKTLSHIQISVGGPPVSVKTVRLTDELGRSRRYRVCTANTDTGHSSRRPAWARLAKDEGGTIGVLITGAHSSLVKVGGLGGAQSHLRVSLDSLSKKALKTLLVPLSYEVVNEDGFVLAREDQERPYYVASSWSTRFHYPGCPRATRISPGNRVVFEERQDALDAGYLPDGLCRP